MAFDWTDPLFWTAGAGTGLGALGGVSNYLFGRSAYDDLLQQAKAQQNAALFRQQQAIDWAKARETQVQAAAQQPLDINAYFSPMQDAQIQALQRYSAANQVATGMPPDLALRMFTTEQLPKFVADQWAQAAALAQGSRGQQLQAMQWLPSAQMQGMNPNPMGQDVLNAYGRFPQYPAMGDVSSLGGYFKGLQMRQDQQQAQQQAAASQAGWMKTIQDAIAGSRGTTNLNLLNDPGMTQIYAPGLSGYDSNSNRIGMPGSEGFSDTDWFSKGGT